MGVRLKLLAGIAVAVAMVPSAAHAATGELQVGVGRADITPPTGYYMMGWVRSDGVIQGQQTRLWARAVVLQEGGRKIALVAEDLNGIPGGMLAQAAALDKDIGFDQTNVLDSASHTHAAPTSFYNFSTYDSVFMTVRSPTDFDLAGTVDPQLYGFMVRQLALAIRRANADLGPGEVGWGNTQIDDLTENRSIEAHLYDHGIHLPYGAGSASMDPMGVLHTIDPNVNVLRVDKLIGGRDVPVGMWSTFANHGTVNKYQFNFYNEDHHGAATHLVEQRIRQLGDVPAGQDVVNAYGNSDEGDISSGLVRSGPAAADYVGTVEAGAFMRAWDEAGQHMSSDPALDWRWTRMCWCGQDTPDGPVADRGAFGLAELTGSEEGRGPLFDVTRIPFEGDHLDVGVGPQGDKEQAPIPLNVPKAVPMMALRIGDRMIVSVPGEMTEDMGRRVRAAVMEASSNAGIVDVVISGLANEYADYFTTPQEYDAQHYEGAATIYGRASSDALEQVLVSLAGDVVSDSPAPAPYAYDPVNGIAADASAAPFPTGPSSAVVKNQPLAEAPRLGHAWFSWQGGQRGYDRPLERAFVLVQRQRADGGWDTVDTDLGLNILWTVDKNGLYRTKWEVPLGAPAGSYRFVIQANHYSLSSKPFAVVSAQTLKVARTTTQPGFAAVTLDYPAAVSHEAVGDPPGDSTADLTARPSHADSGTATFLVNGTPTHASAGPSGVFQVPAPPGARIELKPGAAQDAYGNANGNDLTFTT
ncbi:MAG TPA: neutral/alkaline non-lysosomal ceramidase N-terminal domain-containing protein [Thermoleophilaceae bacterium]